MKDKLFKCIKHEGDILYITDQNYQIEEKKIKYHKKNIIELLNVLKRNIHGDVVPGTFDYIIIIKTWPNRFEFLWTGIQFCYYF